MDLLHGDSLNPGSDRKDAGRQTGCGEEVRERAATGDDGQTSIALEAQTQLLREILAALNRSPGTATTEREAQTAEDAFAETKKEEENEEARLVKEIGERQSEGCVLRYITTTAKPKNAC